MDKASNGEKSRSKGKVENPEENLPPKENRTVEP